MKDYKSLGSPFSVLVDRSNCAINVGVMKVHICLLSTSCCCRFFLIHRVHESDSAHTNHYSIYPLCVDCLLACNILKKFSSLKLQHNQTHILDCLAGGKRIFYCLVIELWVTDHFGPPVSEPP